MLRPRTSRLRRSLVAVLLATMAVGSPSLGGAFRCCTVEGHGAASSAPSEAAPFDDPHAHHRMDAGAPDAPEAPAAPNAVCTCVGPCHLVVLPAAPTSAVSLEIAVGRPVARPEYADADAAPRDRRLARTLPYANGPPRTPSV